MKKLFTLAIASLALVASVHADKVKVLTCGLGIPGIDEPQLMGLGISSDGKYVCGSIESGIGYFIANVDTEIVKWNLAGDEGGELRHVDHNGLAIGITEVGITYNFANELETILTPPQGYKYIVGEALTNDGSMLIGSLVGTGFITEGAYSADGEEWITLPIPSAEELGTFYPGNNGSSAKRVSGDGKVILGCLGSFATPVIWYRNDAGEYEYDYFPARFVKATEEDIDNPEKPLWGLGAFYMDMSNNGRYVVLLGGLKDENNEIYSVPVLYDTQEKTITIFSEKQTISPATLYPTAICNDGTFVGNIGQPNFNASGAYIMKSGETQAKKFIDEFPEFNDKFSEGDKNGFNIPTGMSADGQYICGYNYYCDDYKNPNADAYYVTYIIDTKAEYGVTDIEAEAVEAVPVDYYSIDGNRVAESTRGLKLVRYSDGSVRKEIKR